MKECIFCSVAKTNTPHHEIIWSGQNHIAFLDINPSREGHTLVIPKKHSVNILDLSDDEYTELFKAVKTVSHILKTKIECEIIGVAVEGISVPHSHVHLIPLKNGEKLAEFENHRASPEELLKTALKIRG